jgi:hypothetical protein
MPPKRRFGFEKRTVWEILLGQRGSKTSLGRNSYGCGIISAQESFIKDSGACSATEDRTIFQAIL